MYTIIGLGNPGCEYEKTPHNVGFEIIDYFFEKNKDIFSSKRYDKKIKAEIVKNNNDNFFQYFLNKISNNEKKGMQIIFPKVYMNNSGICVAPLKKEKKNSFKKDKKEIEFDDLVVVHDDIDLPFGKIKIVYNSGHGGHNGIRDIIKVLGSKKFVRIKFGVGIVDNEGVLRKPKEKDGVSNYLVYKKMSKKYQDIVFEKSSEIEKILKNIVKNGYQKAMNDVNGKGK